MAHIVSGDLQKMQVQQAQPVAYSLRVSDQTIALNGYVGKHLKIESSGEIHCLHCQRRTKTSFNQGYCFPCFKSLAQCDRCIMSPELCHFAQGTCREPEWGEQNCFQEHIVYLANSSGLKVGITRHNQVPIRWMDQGAISALPIFSVKSRYLSGLIEVALKEWVADKTNWRKMLKHDVVNMDLELERDRVFELAQDALANIEAEYAGQITRLKEKAWHFEYPSLAWPTKITTHNLDKQPIAEGVLQAIKGQYLIFDTGCLNIRKFTSYHVSISSDA
jgi:hypothetical protein